MCRILFWASILSWRQILDLIINEDGGLFFSQTYLQTKTVTKFESVFVRKYLRKRLMIVIDINVPLNENKIFFAISL